VFWCKIDFLFLFTINVSIRPTTYFSYRSDALVLPQKENEQNIFRRGEAEAFECVREKRLVNIGVQQKI